MEVGVRNSVLYCQIYFSIVLWTTCTNFWYFHNEFMCSVASNERFVGQFLVRLPKWLCEVIDSLSGVLEDAFREIQFLVRLETSILQLYCGLSSFAETFQKFFKFIGRLNSSRTEDLIALTGLSYCKLALKLFRQFSRG